MKWLLIGYMWLFIYRPFEVWPSVGAYRVELLYMLATVTTWILYPQKQWPASTITWGIVGFGGAVLLSWLVSPWYGESGPTVENYFKTSVFYVLLITTVREEGDLRLLCAAFLGIIALYMGHSLLEFVRGRHLYRMDIVRLIAVDLFMNDPNTFGASILYALPLVLPFWSAYSRFRIRFVLVMFILLSAACIVLTGSRSAFVGTLVLCAFTIVWSRHRWTLLILSALCAPFVWLAIPEPLQNRFETIVHPEAGPLNAQQSANGRIEGFNDGIVILLKYPAFGCGPGVFGIASGKGSQSHNLYGQVMGEMGVIGCIAFGAMLATIALTIYRVLRWYSTHSEYNRDFVYYLTVALGFAFVLMLLEGNFGHNLYRYNWLWYGAFLVLIQKIIAQRDNEAGSARLTIHCE
jgi:hypothetical protein